MERVGAWIVGAAGHVGSCTAAALTALARGLLPPVGVLTATEPFCRLPLAPWDAWVVGGHEVGGTTLTDAARALAAEGILPSTIVDAIAPALAGAQADVQPGIGGPGGQAELARIKEELGAFQRRHGLARVVALNVATTEAPWEGQAPETPAALFAALGDGLRLPASALYAAAALDLGMAYVNFTPSLGGGLPALDALAIERRAVHAGADGKTGETLVKSALAPLFDVRRLPVTSWVGQNVLGNPDGAALADDRRRDSKVRSKGAVVGEILGYAPESHVGISYVRDFGDWKVAWDHVAFQGFGGARMTLQFVWQGSDTALAAPLCLDLLRLAELAARRGERGALDYLALFFKAPLGTREHRLTEQYRRLLAHFPELAPEPPR